VHYTQWKWSSKGWNTLGLRKVLIKWWYNNMWVLFVTWTMHFHMVNEISWYFSHHNIWVHLSVLIRYTILLFEISIKHKVIRNYDDDVLYYYIYIYIYNLIYWVLNIDAASWAGRSTASGYLVFVLTFGVVLRNRIFIGVCCDGLLLITLISTRLIINKFEVSVL
jgi:hypothetical protein